MAQMSTVVSIADCKRSRGIAPRRPARFHRRSFGRRAAFTLETPVARKPTISDDLKLFAATFAGGFLFVSVLIA